MYGPCYEGQSLAEHTCVYLRVADGVTERKRERLTQWYLCIKYRNAHLSERYANPVRGAGSCTHLGQEDRERSVPLRWLRLPKELHRGGERVRIDQCRAEWYECYVRSKQRATRDRDVPLAGRRVNDDVAVVGRKVAEPPVKVSRGQCNGHAAQPIERPLPRLFAPPQRRPLRVRVDKERAPAVSKPRS